MSVKSPTSYSKGIWAEYYTVFVLMLKGYLPIKWRYKMKLGEIDLICRTRRKLIFVEIKYRQGSQMKAALAVSAKNQSRVSRCAQTFLQKNPQYESLEMRFDVVTVYGYGKLRHIKNAWSL